MREKVVNAFTKAIIVAHVFTSASKKNEQSYKRRKKAEWKSELELTPHSPPLSKLYKDKRERKSVSAE